MAVPKKRKRPEKQEKSTSEGRETSHAVKQQRDNLGRPHGQAVGEATHVQEQPSKKFRAVGGFMKIPELVADVLARLDYRDLYLLQRVCRGWRDIITTAPPVARILLLKTTLAPADRIAKRRAEPILRVRLNPLLECRQVDTRNMVKIAPFDSDFNFDHLRYPAYGWPSDDHVREVLDKALGVRFRMVQADNKHSEGKSPWTLDLTGDVPGALWDGHISDPPTPDVFLYLQFKNPPIGVFVKVTNPRGVRLRDLIAHAFSADHLAYWREKVVIPLKYAKLRKELKKAAGRGLSGVEIDEAQTYILLQGCDTVPGCENDLR